ncbi:MAG: M50 family metallopeptidase [bacterium]|nr:M50 family metallopeptidase [bacterium]
MNRLHQFALIGSTLLLSWLGMMAVHEAGHVAAARLTGGRVSRIVLHPLAISRTDLSRNPRPLPVAWGGAVAGTLIPLAAWAAARAAGLASAYLLRFFAGFCLLVNGVYLGEDAFFRAGDGGDLIRHGAPPWTLVLFGAAAAAAGIALLNGLGGRFGLAGSGGVDRRHARLALCAAIAVTVLLAALDLR